MNTKTVTAQNCSLFEIDAELEEAFDQMQEQREITGTISNESRWHCSRGSTAPAATPQVS